MTSRPQGSLRKSCPPPPPHPQAELQTWQDWEAFARLAPSCTWTAEWFVVMDAPRPVARFRPADVVAMPMRKVGPSEFWRPGDAKRKRAANDNAGMPLAEEAWEDAADEDAQQEEEEAPAAADCEEEDADVDDAEAARVSQGATKATQPHHQACYSDACSEPICRPCGHLRARSMAPRTPSQSFRHAHTDVRYSAETPIDTPLVRTPLSVV